MQHSFLEVSWTCRSVQGHWQGSRSTVWHRMLQRMHACVSVAVLQEVARTAAVLQGCG
jgi:hypothetical protein